ncbi:MAG: ATP-binding cassette domain-containing protein [Synergistaceae bacterium]|jgi:molybdate transport system ATP-binding protein|nr:ATP-binding cassette domain-containing protein [Synergistaceae bacterium]
MSIHVDIRKFFDGFTLDVAFEAGSEVVGLLGASGCGKSMTLKCIAGILRPDEGHIAVNGITLFDSEKGIDLSPQKRRAGLLFQNYALFPNMTVEQNIMTVLKSGGGYSSGRGRGRRDALERGLRLVERFHLKGLERHYPAQLSGGQQQRTALARIMAGNPAILMLDEPLSALDSYLRWQLEGEFLQMLEEFEGTTLYVSHNRDEVYRLCKKVCVLHLGRSEGERPGGVRTVRELFESPNTLASSILSGCKNYSRAEKITPRTVYAADWGVKLDCSAPWNDTSPDDIAYVGVRAHHVIVRPAFGEQGEGANVFPCRVLRVIQDVFSTIVNVQPLSAQPLSAEGGEFSLIRTELPKQEGQFREGDIVSAEIKPENVMLLKSS